MKILQFKNTIAEIENSLDGLNCSKIEIREERISKCDDVNYLAVQKREIKFKKRALSTYMIVPKELAFMLSQFQKQRRVQGRKKKICEEMLTENSQVYQKYQIKTSLDLHKERF